MPRRWNEIDRAPVPVADPALDRYLEQVAATHVHGGYLISRWRAVEHSDPLAADSDHLRTFDDDEVVGRNWPSCGSRVRSTATWDSSTRGRVRCA